MPDGGGSAVAAGAAVEADFAADGQGRLQRRSTGELVGTYRQARDGAWVLQLPDRNVAEHYMPEDEGWAVDADLAAVLPSWGVRAVMFNETMFGEEMFAPADLFSKSGIKGMWRGRASVTLPRRYWSKTYDFDCGRDLVHLHVHSEFSYLDGASSVTAIAQKAARMGCPAMALTDHGVLTGITSFRSACKEVGVKPLCGVEAYLRDDAAGARDRKERATWHLILIAQDQAGWSNLVALNNIAHGCGFYYKPCIDWEALEQHAEGILCTTACMSGPVTSHLTRRGLSGQIEPDVDAAWTALHRLRSIFGDRLYVEIQCTDMDEYRVANPYLVQWAGHLGIPLVAATDAHYCNREDRQMHRLVLALSKAKRLEDEAGYPGDTFFLAGRSDLVRMFEQNHPEISPAVVDAAIGETVRLAERVSVWEDDTSPKIPVVKDPPDLIRIAEDGLADLYRRRMAERRPFHWEAYWARLHEEAATIGRLGFMNYFVIIYQIAKFCERRGLKIGSRGSAAGSMFLWCLGVTEVDPIEHGLLFERFINEGRMRGGGLPDVDLDFAHESRQEVLDFLNEEYQTAAISSFMERGPKSALQDVGRALPLAPAHAQQLSDMVRTHTGARSASIDANIAMSGEFARAVMQQENYAAFCAARTIEGLVKTTGTHAAGVIVADHPLEDVFPMRRPEKDGVQRQVQAEMGEVDKRGYLKVDVLGSKNQSVLRVCERLTGVQRDRIPLDDRRVFAEFQRGNTGTLAQFGSAQMIDLLTKVRPNCFADLAACNALVRPGAMKWVDAFASRTHVPPVAEAVPILQDTRGIILYQEQSMRLAQQLAGFDLVEADDLRRAIGKKKREEMIALKERFMQGCSDRGVDMHGAEQIWNAIADGADYGFNKSHAVVYSLVGYWEGWYRTHHPAEYFVAEFSAYAEDSDKIRRYLREAAGVGVTVAPPDVNLSADRFRLEASVIRFGLSSVKHVSQTAALAIMEVRSGAPFEDVADFRKRIRKRDCTSRAMQSLICAGAFDFCNRPRADMWAEAEETKPKAQRKDELIQQARSEGWTSGRQLRMEYEALGFYLTGSPVDLFARERAEHGTVAVRDLSRTGGTFTVLALVDDVEEKKTSKGGLMGVVTLGDHSGSDQMAVWPEQWATEKHKFVKGGLVAVTTSLGRSGKLSLLPREKGGYVHVVEF